LPLVSLKKAAKRVGDFHEDTMMRMGEGDEVEIVKVRALENTTV